MTIYEVIDNLEKIAKTQPLIGSTGEGDIYEYMNADPSVKYATFFITQNQHTETEMFDNYNLTLFYIDRLTDNEDNRVEIQSTGKETLSNIIRTFKDVFDAESENINYQPFTQRFNDSCAGVFASLSIEVEKNTVCGEDYQYAVNAVSGGSVVIRNQKKSVSISENGKTTVSYDNGYTGLDSVQIDVNVPEKKIQPIKYFSVSENSIWGFGPDKGYDGVAEIEVDVNVPTPVFKTEEKTVSVVENGQTIVEKSTDKDGMTKVIVNVDVPEKTFTTEELTANENGVYTPSADGYSKVTVNVPKEEFKTEEKTVSIVNNGQTVIDKSVEADGMTRVTVDVNVPGAAIDLEKIVDIETNGTVTITPAEGFEGIAGATVNVNVPPVPDKTIRVKDYMDSTGKCFLSIGETNVQFISGPDDTPFQVNAGRGQTVEPKVPETVLPLDFIGAKNIDGFFRRTGEDSNYLQRVVINDISTIESMDDLFRGQSLLYEVAILGNPRNIKGDVARMLWETDENKPAFDNNTPASSVQGPKKMYYDKRYEDEYKSKGITGAFCDKGWEVIAIDPSRSINVSLATGSSYGSYFSITDVKKFIQMEKGYELRPRPGHGASGQMVFNANPGKHIKYIYTRGHQQSSFRFFVDDIYGDWINGDWPWNTRKVKVEAGISTGFPDGDYPIYITGVEMENPDGDWHIYNINYKVYKDIMV